MIMNQSACTYKVNHAVQFLLRNRNSSVRKAMLVAEFQKKHLNDLSLHKAISRSFIKVLRVLVPPTTVVQREGTSLDLSTLTAETDVASTTTAACSSTTDDAITVPLPKQKKQRTTASALEKKRVDDLRDKGGSRSAPWSTPASPVWPTWRNGTRRRRGGGARDRRRQCCQRCRPGGTTTLAIRRSPPSQMRRSR